MEWGYIKVGDFLKDISGRVGEVIELRKKNTEVKLLFENGLTILADLSDCVQVYGDKKTMEGFRRNARR